MFAPNGKAGAVDLSSLLETAIRLGPDRLVIGEVRGREAMSVVSALTSSIDGALVAMTGEGSGVVLNRLATLVRASGVGGGDAAVLEWFAIARALAMVSPPRIKRGSRCRQPARGVI